MSSQLSNNYLGTYIFENPLKGFTHSCSNFSFLHNTILERIPTKDKEHVDSLLFKTKVGSENNVKRAVKKGRKLEDGAAPRSLPCSSSKSASEEVLNYSLRQQPESQMQGVSRRVA